MKKVFVIAVTALVAFSSCKEKGPKINFGNDAKAVDTTYVTTVEAAQSKNIVVEEFTGASCSNCPAARDLLSNIVADPKYTGHVFTMGIHIKNYVQSNPVDGLYKHDFRTQKGTDIGNDVYGSVTAMPIAGIDRVPYNGEMLLLKTAWASAISNRIAVTPPANLTVSSSFDQASRTATFKLHVAYTQAIKDPQFVTLSIIEDSLVDAQEYPNYIDTFYTFNHVLRDYITPTGGTPILSNVTIEPGRVYDRTFTYQLDPSWIPEHCKIIAFLHYYSATSKEIVQAAETEVK